MIIMYLEMNFLICPNCNTKLIPKNMNVAYFSCTTCRITNPIDWWANFEGIEGLINARNWKLYYGLKVDLRSEREHKQRF